MIQTPGGFGQLGVIQLDFGLCQMTYLTAKSTLEEKKRPAYVDSLTHDFNHKRKQKSADPAFTAPFDNAGPSL